MHGVYLILFDAAIGLFLSQQTDGAAGGKRILTLSFAVLKQYQTMSDRDLVMP